MKKIKTMTSEQRASFGPHVNKWIRRAIRSDWDQEAARAAVAGIYRAAGLVPPRVIVCWSSPFAAHLGHLLFDTDSVWDSVWDSVGASVWASVQDSVRDSVWSSVWSSVGASVGASVEDSVGDSVWDSVGASVRDSVGASVGTSVWASVRASVRDSVKKVNWVAPHDSAGWVSWRAYLSWYREHLGLEKQTDKMSAYLSLDAAGAFWFWWYKDAAFLCAPPVMKFDRGKDDGSEPYRFHCSDGPALLWPDGYALWYWRGINVPQNWIEEPEKLACADWETEKNAERKRAICEIVGWNKIVEWCGAKRIARDDSGELWEGQLGDDDGKPAKWVCVKCPSSGRVYFNRVAPETRTCVEGLASRWDMQPSEYVFASQT